MPEAVVVSVARSPIGRAVKGSLATIRPDDVASQVIQAVLDKVPELDPRQIDDLMRGCAQPAGGWASAHSPFRRASVPSGKMLGRERRWARRHSSTWMLTADERKGAWRRPCGESPTQSAQNRRAAC